MGPVKGKESIEINRLPSKHISAMRGMICRTPVCILRFLFGPCFDFLRRDRIERSLLISHHSL
jgi:hypothetical protein